MNRYAPHDLNLNHECFFYNPLEVLGHWQDREPEINASIAILLPAFYTMSVLEGVVHRQSQRMVNTRRAFRSLR